MTIQISKGLVQDKLQGINVKEAVGLKSNKTSQNPTDWTREERSFIVRGNMIFLSLLQLFKNGCKRGQQNEKL